MVELNGFGEVVGFGGIGEIKGSVEFVELVVSGGIGELVLFGGGMGEVEGTKGSVMAEGLRGLNVV